MSSTHTIIEESGLRFYFPADWGIRKYDEHRFYKGLSGRGHKAVDFIVLPPDGSLWLIEVKNYRSRFVDDKEYIPRIKPAEELADSLSRKMEDTLLAIEVIKRYYQRKWLYRLLEPLLQKWQRYQFDWVFWTEAAQRADLEEQLHLLLWLELPQGKKKYRTKVYSAVESTFVEEDLNLHTGGSVYNPLPNMKVEFL